MAYTIYIEKENILVNMPNPSSRITSDVAISYGDFQGNDYFGYNIPFYIDNDGDVQTIFIGSHKLNAKDFKSGDCVRLHIKVLHIGKNSLPIQAIDSRGNKSSSSLSISIATIRSNNSDDDYDDLEDRINDLEDRLDELE